MGLPLAPGLIGELVGPVVHCFLLRGPEAELIWQAQAEREVEGLWRGLQAVPKNDFFSKFGNF